MYLHPTYAVTPECLPLGVVAVDSLQANDCFPFDRGAHRPGRVFHAPTSTHRVAEMAAYMPGTRLVYVADREADMIELMRCARDAGTPADWLVRAKTNRALPEGPSCGR
jgi:hypothetical protein